MMTLTQTMLKIKEEILSQLNRFQLRCICTSSFRRHDQLGPSNAGDAVCNLIELGYLKNYVG